MLQAPQIERSTGYLCHDFLCACDEFLKPFGIHADGFPYRRHGRGCGIVCHPRHLGFAFVKDFGESNSRALHGGRRGEAARTQRGHRGIQRRQQTA